MKIRRAISHWLPVVVWMCVIFAGSTDLMSAEHTSRFLVPLLRWLKPDISLGAIEAIQFVLRKLAHLTEYAILAALVWRAIRHSANRRAKMWMLFAAVWLACAAFAVTDEFHQWFVSSRTSSLGDVTIDMCGALLGLSLCFGFKFRETKVPREVT